MNASEFISKWNRSELRERQGSQEHFIDLCRLMGHPTPAEDDPEGERFCFERGAAKEGGGDGFADVWKKGFFGWEYKGRHKNLDAAYDQLLRYRNDLENPPLLVVSDMDEIIVRTNYTGTKSARYDVRLSNLTEPRSLEILRHLFFDPDKLRPGAPSTVITEDAARRIGELAVRLRERGLDPAEVARFLDRMVFAMFAEDVGLLPAKLIEGLTKKSRSDPGRFSKLIGQLFEVMAHGGDFGMDEIRHFNGNLFHDAAVLDLTAEEIEELYNAAKLDWDAVDPSVFGTLFERGMDPDKRSQLGAHYTSREDIETIVEPVVMAPLRRDWGAVKDKLDALLDDHRKNPAFKDTPLGRKAWEKKRREALVLLQGWLRQLAQVRILDPACGSGNFLYVALQKLKDLEKEAINYFAQLGYLEFSLGVGPWQLYGLEINPYAFELAQMTVWIGYLQWTRANGFPLVDSPLLRPMTNFTCKDAILDLSDPQNPKEPEWPRADFIIGNPPFLGDKLMRGELGDDYVEKLRAFYDGRVPGGADLCCYWFEKGKSEIEKHPQVRVGLLATQGIRGGANREVLKRIKETGEIFFAESDRPWVLDGANVHVSMVGFDSGLENVKILDRQPVKTINPNLTSHGDISSTNVLAENRHRSFLGSCKGGPFDISEEEAMALLNNGGNPNLRPNSDVIRPVFNSDDLVKTRNRRWIIDTSDLTLEKAAGYDQPHHFIVARVKPRRDKNRDKWLRENWWRPQRARPEMRRSVAPMSRFLVTTTTSKHRLFAWMHHPQLPDHQLIVFARDDDYFFGVLHSRFHEVWALKLGTRLETRPRYTPTTCFETFPLPRPTQEQEEAIGAAARELNEMRERWLNPPEWTKEEVLEFPGSADGPWARYVHAPDARGVGTVRYPRIVPKDEEAAKKLKARTLTNLYNERPTWLALAHEKLDAAVAAAYGWPADLRDEEILEKLLALNLKRAAEENKSGTKNDE